MMSLDEDEKLRANEAGKCDNFDYDATIFIYREIIHMIIFCGNYLYEKIINVVDVSRHLRVFGIIADDFVASYLEYIKKSLLENKVKFMHTIGCFDEYIVVEIEDIHVGDFGSEKGLGKIAVGKKCAMTLDEYNRNVKLLQNPGYFTFRTRV